MYEIFSPGVVGPVGDVLVNTRLKHSAPDLPIRWENTLNQMQRLGANVQNGYPKNYQGNGFLTDILPLGQLMNHNTFKTKYGWTYQDVRAPDKTYQPEMSQTFGSFDNLRASIINRTRTGIQFNKLPHGYGPAPGDVPRGGAVPRITDIAAGDFTLEQDGYNSVVTRNMSTPINASSGMPKPQGRFGQSRR